MSEKVKLDSKQRASLKVSVKQKLQAFGKYIDEELPEYVMVMVGNSRSHAQMAAELKVFLGNSTVDFTDWLFEKLSRLSGDPSGESDSREGTPLMDEKPALKLMIPMRPVVVDARDVIRSKREEQSDCPKPRNSVVSSVVTMQERSRPKSDMPRPRNTSLLTRAIADATKSTQPASAKPTRTAVPAVKLATRAVKETSKNVVNIKNGSVSRRPVHERLGHRVGRMERPYIEDISSDEEEKEPVVKRVKSGDDEHPGSPEFIVTLDGAEGMFDDDVELSDPEEDNSIVIHSIKTGGVFSRIGTLPSSSAGPTHPFALNSRPPRPRIAQQQANAYSFQPPQQVFRPTVPFRPRMPSQHRMAFRPPSQYKLVKNQFPSREKLKWTATATKPSAAMAKTEPDKKKTVSVAVTH